MRKTVFGLTGQTGAGKSTVCDFLREKGFPVIDCDRLARDVTFPGGECLAALSDAFGREILTPEGALNRRALGGIVFSDRAQLLRLNGLIFPFIIREIENRLQGLEGAVVLDAPTLFESGTDKLCSRILAVTAKEEVRLGRIMARDGLSEEEAMARIRSQHDEAFFREHADFLIENNGSIEALSDTLARLDRYLREALDGGSIH